MSLVHTPHKENFVTEGDHYTENTNNKKEEKKGSCGTQQYLINLQHLMFNHYGRGRQKDCKSQRDRGTGSLL